MLGPGALFAEAHTILPLRRRNTNSLQNPEVKSQNHRIVWVRRDL